MGRRTHLNEFATNATRWLAMADEYPEGQLAPVQEQAIAKEFEDLTTRILAYKPLAAWEALVMLEVVREEIATGGRTDGLDIRAVAAVMTWFSDFLHCELTDGLRPSVTRQPTLGVQA